MFPVTHSRYIRHQNLQNREDNVKEQCTVADENENYCYL